MAGKEGLPSAVSNTGSDAPEDTTCRLKLVNTIESQLEEGDEVPQVDIIHVVGVDSERRLSLDAITGDSVSSRRREFVFQCEISSLLLGDIAFDAIRTQAEQFLDELRPSSGEDETPQPARIFAAYDFGALILKKAISIDSTSHKRPRWPGIFYSTVQLIFWGCFQRRRNLLDFDMKLWDFLQAHKEEAPWASFVTPTCIRPLADAGVEVTEQFLHCGITFRTRTLSIYADESSKRTDPAFDFFTATLGVDTEIAMQDDPNSQDSPVSGLDKIVCYRKQNWVMDSRWIALQKMLLPMAFPQHRHMVERPVSPDKLLESKAYKDWATARKSPILYIQGQNEADSRSLAEQMALLRQSKLRKKDKHGTPALSFTFSSRDPARATMDRMICSAILQTLTAFEAQAPLVEIFLDLHKIQRGWTLKDTENLFLMFMAPPLEAGGLLVLHEVDECDPTSRKALWDELQNLAELSDSYPKVIITSRRKLSLLGDTDKSNSWCLYNEDVETADDLLPSGLQPAYVDDLVSRLCPGGHRETQIKRVLQTLTSMEKDRLEQIIRLIQDHTGWPLNPSPRAWSEFEALFNRIELSTSPAIMLNWVLRSVTDKKGLLWILDLLIYGHRPIHTLELARLLCYCDRGKGYRSFSTPLSPEEVNESLRLLKHWIPGLVDFGRERPALRASISDLLLDEDPRFLWNEMKTVAHRTILDFLRAYLTAPEICDRLERLYTTYLSDYNADDEQLVPSFSVAEDILCYVITAFPYHLEKYPQFLPSIKHLLQPPDRSLLPWARMYWAMGNPFSRPSAETIHSPLNMLLSRENLSATYRKELEAITGYETTSPDQLSGSQKLEDAGFVASLARAVSAGDENAALEYTQRIILRTASGGQDIDPNIIATVTGATGIKPLLSTLLWRATWLNMGQLADFLLQKAGVSPDPEDTVSARFPSPLYLASVLGHWKIVQCLLQAGANTRVLRSGTHGVLFAAAVNGYSDIIRAVVAKDPELLEMKQPLTPLYSASLWGQWKAAETLLDLGARPDYNPDDDGWSPLIAAAESGYIQTVRTLLENKADPNLRGPDNQDTALWFASVRGKSVQCVRLLLEHGADPNHEFLQPPLLGEICSALDIKPEKKIAILDVLIANTPPIEVDKVDSYGTTGLMWAATRGEATVVEWLIAHNATFSITNEQKQGALYYAIMNDHNDIARRLLDCGAPVNDLTDNGDTLLQLAIYRSTELVSILLDGSADPELTNSSGSTAINTAVVQEKAEIVKLLIDRKVDIAHRDSEGWCPIHDASGHAPNPEIVRILAEAGANLREATDLGWAPLHLASKHAHVEVLKVLLEFHGAIDLDARTPDGETPLIKAVHSGNHECIRRLLQAGADINAQRSDGWTPLMVATGKDEPHELVDLFLSRPGLDIGRFSNTRGTALHLACTRLELDIVTKLLDHGAEINQEGPGIWPTPLMAVCMPCQMPKSDDRSENVDKIDKIVRLLVSRGANVKTTYNTIISNLLSAAMLGSGPSTINYLLSEGLSLKERGGLDRLPIHYAAANGIENFSAVRLSDRDITSEDVAGKTALHWAAQFGHLRTVEKILAHAPTDAERRKRVNHADIDGWTALCWALRPHRVSSVVSFSEPCETEDTVQVLLDAGADVSINCRLGGEDERFTPLEIAKLHGASSDVIGILIEAERASSADEEPTRRIRPYEQNSYYCDICLHTIWGPVHECQTCADFDVCKKCFGRIDMYHGHLKDENGEPHSFKLTVEAESEIKEPSESGAQSDNASPKGGSEGSGSGVQSHHEGNTVVVDDTMEAIMNFSVDLDFESPDVLVENSP